MRYHGVVEAGDGGIESLRDPWHVEGQQAHRRAPSRRPGPDRSRNARRSGAHGFATSLALGIRDAGARSDPSWIRQTERYTEGAAGADGRRAFPGT
jgi:hypothetical protein